MGFFGLSDAGNMGFASVKNTQNFTDAQLFEKLSAVKVSFGTAQMGDIKGTPAVMYKNATPEFDIFARVHKGNVIMGKIGADGVSSAATALNMGLNMFLERSDDNSSAADRYVDELLSVIKKLEAGEEVTETSAAKTKETVGDGIALYMKQKMLSIKPKFDIFDKDEKTVYHVEGDITRLNFQYRGKGQRCSSSRRSLSPSCPNTRFSRATRKSRRSRRSSS